MTKVAAAMLMVVILPLVVASIVNSYTFERILRDKISYDWYQRLEETKQNMATLFEGMVSASNSVALDNSLTGLLQSRPSPAPGGWISEKDIPLSDMITAAQSSSLYSYDLQISLFGNDGHVYSSYSNDIGARLVHFERTSWYRRVLGLNGYVAWFTLGSDYRQPKRTMPTYLALARVIKNRTWSRDLGVVLVTLRIDPQVKRLLAPSSAREPALIFVTNRFGEPILTAGSMKMTPARLNRTMDSVVAASGGSRGTRMVRIGHAQYVASWTRLPETGWRLEALLPNPVVTDQVIAVQNRWLFLIALFSVVVIGLGMVFAWRITRPLHELSALMLRVSDGDFSVKAPVRSRDETGRLARTFNTMTGEMQWMIARIEEEERRRVEARLESLQAQIRPHFLFNTLNGIKWMALMNRCEDAARMITTLGRLLEAAFDGGRESVPLRDEISLAKDYIALQKLRYGDRFTVEYDVAREMELVEIPVLLLQPLIENSIVHAFQGLDRRGHIRISALRRECCGIIEVADNGVGADLDVVRHCIDGDRSRAELSAQNRFGDHDIGLSNVRERVQLHFGPEYGLTVRGTVGGGMTVEVRTP